MSSATTVAGALVLGLATSVHCVGMCGALACGVTALPGGETRSETLRVARREYQIQRRNREVAYALQIRISVCLRARRACYGGVR